MSHDQEFGKRMFLRIGFYIIKLEFQYILRISGSFQYHLLRDSYARQMKISTLIPLGFSRASLPNFNFTYTIEIRFTPSNELNFNQFPETLFPNYHKCFDVCSFSLSYFIHCGCLPFRL